MIRKIKAWQASDGTLFKKRKEAERHEEKLVFDEIKKERDRWYIPTDSILWAEAEL